MRASLSPLLFVAIVGMTPAAFGQKLLYHHNGDDIADIMGVAVGTAGDVNADGHDDYIVGIPGDDPNGDGSGAVRVFSGLDGSLLYQIDGESGGDSFGLAVGGGLDVDRDGHDDFIVGAPYDDDAGNNTGRVRVYSGLDGSVLWTFDGRTNNELFGTSLSNAGDVDGDGFEDIIVGAPNSNVNGVNAGHARVISSRTGQDLYEYFGDAPAEFSGQSVSGAGDVDGDGFCDFIIGAPWAVPPSSSSGGSADGQASGGGPGNAHGRARVFSGIDGTMIHEFYGTGLLDDFARSVSGAGDVNGDGFDDLIAGSPHDDDNGMDCGGARIYSGSDGSVLHEFWGDSAWDHMGASVCALGDINNDGYDDVAVGTPPDDNNGNGSGMVRVFSGFDGKILATWHGPAPNTIFGLAVANAGDVNADGFNDVIVGSPGADVVFEEGAATVFTLAPRVEHAESRSVDAPTTGTDFGRATAWAGDFNNDGHHDVVIGAPLANTNGTEAGHARVISGKDGSVLWSRDGDAAGDRFGWSVSGAGDFDNDGFADIIVGAPSDDRLAVDAGSARIYSGQTGLEIWSLDGAAGDSLGWSVAAMGDMNLDTFGDVVIGAPGADVNGPDSGQATVFLGPMGAASWTTAGDSGGDRLGAAVAGIRNVNYDGALDFIAGAPGDDDNGMDAGSARVISGLDGSIVWEVEGPTAGAAFGSAVGGSGDVDQDGRDEFVVGAPLDSTGGPAAGSVTVYSGIDASVLFTRPGNPNDRCGHAVGLVDADADGFADIVYGSPGDTADRGRLIVWSWWLGEELASFQGPIAGDELGFSLGTTVDANCDGYGDVVVGLPFTVPGGSVHVVESVKGTDPGSFRTYDIACFNSAGGKPTIMSDSPALLGGTLTVRVSGSVPNTIGIASFAAARFNPRLDLDFFEIPCAWLSNTLFSFPALVDANGFGELSVPLPNGNQFLGGELHGQWVLVDLPANPFGVILSNGGVWRLGVR